MAQTLDFSDETRQQLYLRLAAGDKDVRAAQQLRYQVFYQEMQAVASEDKRCEQRDFDPHDDISDHLLVVDSSRKDDDGDDQVVGCYRLLRAEALPQGASFYTEGEFDISALKNSDMNLLELGRSCVDVPYRTRQVLNLLWHGISRYVFHYRIDALFGCASFAGTDPKQHQAALQLLTRDYLAPREICPKALPESSIAIGVFDEQSLSVREALEAIPPLIKGYLRVGAYIGEGAYIDTTFNTIDVCMLLLRARISDRYYNHYARDATEQEKAKDARNS